MTFAKEMQGHGGGDLRVMIEVRRANGIRTRLDLCVLCLAEMMHERFLEK